jgi:hypothetical protein
MPANPILIKYFLKNLLSSLEEKHKAAGGMMIEHCKRSNGTERKWFDTVEAALEFQKHHPEGYGADAVVLCGRCSKFHCSHPDWLADRPWETPVAELAVN